MNTKVLKVFECRQEEVNMDGDKPIIMHSFYNCSGKYIGDVEWMRKLIEKGITPEIYNNNNVCSIGKSYKDGKWYGWSHRAMYGFQIGDRVKEGDCCASSGWTDEYLKTHPDPFVLPVGFEAKTEDDCKRMAMAFASSVS